MISIGTIFIVLTLLFLAFLLLRSLTSISVCALCAAVASGWIGLFGLWSIGWDISPTFIAMMMGASATGLLYYLTNKLPDRFSVFSFPFLLTVFACMYTLLGGSIGWYGIFTILGLWVVTVGVYMNRYHPTVRSAFDSVVACCKDW